MEGKHQADFHGWRRRRQVVDWVNLSRELDLTMQISSGDNKENVSIKEPGFGSIELGGHSTLDSNLPGSFQANIARQAVQADTNLH